MHIINPNVNANVGRCTKRQFERVWEPRGYRQATPDEVEAYRRHEAGLGVVDAGVEGVADPGALPADRDRYDLLDRDHLEAEIKGRPPLKVPRGETTEDDLRALLRQADEDGVPEFSPPPATPPSA